MRRPGVKLFDRDNSGNTIEAQEVDEVPNSDAIEVRQEANKPSPWGRDGGGN